MQRELRKRLSRLELRQKEKDRPTAEEVRAAMEFFSEAGIFPPGTRAEVEAEVRQALAWAELINESVLGGSDEHQETA